ncbi:hypothetical protein HQ560_16375, partial [bacterium]|nr:hypothetical protein [bacterium]
LPADPNVMAGQGCEWRLDPKTGRAACVGVIAHETHNFARFCQGPGGRTYLIGTQNSFGVKVYERLAPGDYRLRASVREARPKGKDDAGSVRFWSDANDDQTEQDSEVVAFPRHFSFLGYYAWSASVGGDLAIYGGWLDRNTNQGEGYHIPVTGVTACGAPLWDVANPRKLPALVSPLPSLDNTLVCDMPYADRDERFVRCMDTATGKTLWTYPNDWHGVHGSHRAPPPEPGLLRGVFGFIGAAKLPEPVGDVWVMNTNVGEWHAMTSRGFYLTRLFESNPMRYRFPDEAVPGALMDGAPSGAGGEDFGGSLVQAADGRVYLQSGKTAMWNIEVVGLDTVRPLPSTGAVTVTADDVKKAESWRVTYLQESAGTRRLDVAKHTPAFTGDLRRDFAKTSLVTFRKSRETEITAGLAWDDTNLYLGFDVRDPSPWVNQAEVAERMYVSGDTVDLQLATDPKADSKRREAVLGDLRLSIGLAGAKPAAVIYRKVAKERHPKTFRSGIVRDGYIMDSVVVIDDAKIVVKVHGSSRYVVQAAIPLAALGLEPKAGLTLGADLGVTHGDPAGANTVLRTHWSNQNTGIVDDEVFELKMEPARWGEITFKE